MNLNRNNSFVNWAWLPLLCETFGAILLVLVGLMAVRQAGSQTKLIVVDFKIFKILYGLHRYDFHGILTKVQCYYSVTYAF